MPQTSSKKEPSLRSACALIYIHIHVCEPTTIQPRLCSLSTIKGSLFDCTLQLVVINSVRRTPGVSALPGATQASSGCAVSEKARRHGLQASA